MKSRDSLKIGEIYEYRYYPHGDCSQRESDYLIERLEKGEWEIVSAASTPHCIVYLIRKIA